MSIPSLTDYSRLTERRGREQQAEFAPLVSVVTVTLNSAGTLARTIESVHGQTGLPVEQIFVDGGSTDDTLDVIRRLARPTDYWVTEKDRGISDAFNKGVALARGQYVGILNADDWYSPNQLSEAIAALRAGDADFVFGDAVFYEAGRPFFLYRGDPDYARIIDRRMPSISHTTVLVGRSWFERIGLFNLSYRNAMDYDWLLRLHRAGARAAYSPAIVGHMTHDGVSNRQFKRTVQEVKTIAVAHGRNPVAASAEAMLRYGKTMASQPLKIHARPFYLLVRRTINRSFVSPPGVP